MSVDQLRESRKNAKKSKKAAPAKPKAAPAAPKEEPEAPPPDDANIDAQAEEMIESIKSATENIRSFDTSADSGD